MSSAVVDRDRLGQALALELVTVAGVRRLEPRLGSRLRGRATGGAVTSLPVRVRGTTVDLEVDLATDASRPAVQVADAVQRRAREIVTAQGLQIGWVQVSVLSVEP